MSDLISREALKKAIEQYQIQWNKNCETDIAKWDSCESILAIINHAPTVKPCENCDLYFKAMTKEEMRKGGVV